jgi:hypothetical protein
MSNGEWLARYNTMVVQRDRWRDLAEAAHDYRCAEERDRRALTPDSAEQVREARATLDGLLHAAGLEVD